MWCSRLIPPRLAGLLFPLLGVLLAVTPVGADDLSQHVRSYFEADREVEIVGPSEERQIGIVRRGQKTVAYFASSYPLLGAVGYSGKPIDVLVVVAPDGVIRAAKLIAQTEPILTLGIAPDALEDFVSGFEGANVKETIRELQDNDSVPDAVSGATVSSSVIRNAILQTGRTALELATADGGLQTTVPGPDATWDSLVDTGTIATRTISFQDASQAMPGATTLPEGEGTFAEFSAAIVGSRAMGVALVGAKQYDKLATGFAADDTVLLIAGRGVYSIKGTSWRRSDVFERLEVASGTISLALPALSHQRLESIVLPGAPEFREAMLVAIPASSGIKSDAPLTVSLVVDKTSEGASAPARFDLTPLNEEAEVDRNVDAGTIQFVEEPLWRENWRVAAPDLAILAVMLLVLFLALYVSRPIVRNPTFYNWFRAGFLLVTLVWLGWIAGAQLSVVQLVAFLQSLMGGFRWDVFLLAPLIFTLWAFVALGILFWGRGVYCGWLCPFGALQELIHKAGQRLGIKRIEILWEIHERLWPIKYVALLAIIGLSLQDTELAFKAAEIEPFKTAIILRFARAWPYVAFVAVILAAGLFVERVYCRYLCPLGAAMAIPSKFKIFDWLIRRPQCGRECRLCATTCTVQAIDPIGRINPNECIYCLKCQVNYYDAETCVPLKMRARRKSTPTPTAPPPAA